MDVLDGASNKDVRRERRLGHLVLAGVVWIALHVFTGGRNLIYGVDCNFHGFDTMAFLLGAAYTVSLLVFDMLLFYAGSRTACRVMMNFWEVCGIIASAALGASWMGIELNLGIVLPVLLTPYFPLRPLMDRALVGRDSTGGMTAVVLLCLGEFLYCLWLWRWERAAERKRVPEETE